jgi:type II restriction enzyme
VTDDQLKRLFERISELRSDQVERVESLVSALLAPPRMTASGVGFADQAFCARFADSLTAHHLASYEPFTKDKFEHAMVRALRLGGHQADLAPRGNPGHDLTVDAERWSLKTQAAANIRRDTIHISKFMELGRGRWETEADLVGLRDQMLAHMEAYDRIFSLRCFRSKLSAGSLQYDYELVEIPKALLLRARDGQFRLVETSRQTPKPGYCTVASNSLLLFNLYFDGGTERKLQIKDLSKAYCSVLATWAIILPTP